VRLLLVSNDYPPKAGGIQQYLGNLIAAYPGDVRVLAPADPAAPHDPTVVRGPHRFMWPTRRIIRWVRSEIATFDPDVVLFGAPYPLPHMIKSLRRTVTVPMGVLCHGAEVTLPAAFPFTRGLLARSLRRADVLFAVSRFTERKVAALTRRPVTYVGGGVDIEQFRCRESRTGAPPVIGCVSRFIPRKGQAAVIDAVAMVRSRGVDVELLLVGRGRLEKRLRARAARRGVPARFAVGVAWEELAGLYAGMDVFCMPCRSRWGGLEIEGLGLVFLEAAATGLPVLAGTSGGSPETVVPGVTGYVVSGVDDIVEAISALVADPARAAAMGAAGRKRVEDEFTWRHVVERLVAGFSQVGGTELE